MKNIRKFWWETPIFCMIGIIALSFLLIQAATARGETLSMGVTALIGNIERWQILADMDRPRGDPGVVAVGNKIHVINGYWSTGYGYVYSHVAYDTQTGAWQELQFPPLDTQRSDFVAVNVDGKIYAIGGWRDVNPNDGIPGVSLNLNYMYDPASNIWTTDNAPLPTAVSGAGGVVLNGLIYVIGGYKSNPTDITNIVQIYNPANNTWSSGTPMQNARSGLGAVLLGGKIYVIGGQSSGSDVEIFTPGGTPGTGTWTDGPALPEKRLSAAVAVRGSKIHVMGGVETHASAAEKTMFILDPGGTNTWSTGAPMPTARRACRAAAVNEIIYVIGGNSVAGYANEAYGLFPPPGYLPIVLK